MERLNELNYQKNENEKIYHLVNTQGKRSLDEEDIKNIKKNLNVFLFL